MTLSKQSVSGSPDPNENHDDNSGAHTPPRQHPKQPESNEEKILKEEHIGMIIGALAAMILLLFGVAVFIVLKSQRKKHDEEVYDVYEKHRMTQDTDETKVRTFIRGPSGSSRMLS